MLLFSEDLAEVLELADVVLVMFRVASSARFDRRRRRRRADRPLDDRDRIDERGVEPVSRIRGDRRERARRCGVRVGVPLLSLVASRCCSARVILVLTGADPVEVYRTMFDASLNGTLAIERTLTYATPLILTGLAAAVAFRMKVYNIGAEGQLFMGAIAASAVALTCRPDADAADGGRDDARRRPRRARVGRFSPQYRRRSSGPTRSSRR